MNPAIAAALAHGDADPTWKRIVQDVEDRIADRDQLMINVRSQGQWAAFGVTDRFSECLLRPGTLDYTGPAADWLDRLKRDSRVSYETPGGKLLQESPLRAPLRHGLMILDYDARQVGAWLVDARSPFLIHVPGWSLATRNPMGDARLWVRRLVQQRRVAVHSTLPAGHHGLTWPGLEETPDRLGSDQDPGWLRTYLITHGVLDDATDRVDRAAYLQLQAPGWRLGPDGPVGDGAATVGRALDGLLSDLSEQEARAWLGWDGATGLGGWVCARFRAFVSEHGLAQRLAPAKPAAGAGRPRI